jgi:hypothetical protein
MAKKQRPKGDRRELLELLDDKEYLADLFHILHFEEVEVPRPPAATPILRVPVSIDKLFTKWNKESEELLTALVIWARPETASFNPSAMTQLVSTIRSRYLALRELSLVRPIDDEADPEILALIRQLLPDAAPRGSLLDRMTQTVRTSVTTILSVSKRTGKGILTRGRKLSRFLRDKVIQLELPRKADDVVQKKQEFTARVFAFKGGRATKFFVGVAFGVAGILVSPAAPAAVPVAVAGLAFAFVDP